MSILFNDLTAIDKDIKKIMSKYLLTNQEIKNILIFADKLKDYVRFLNNFNKKTKNINKHNKLIQSDFNRAQNRIILAAYRLECVLRLPVVKKRLRELFRKATGSYIFQSKVAKRAYEKPRGYPGDYLIFEMSYDDRPVSCGVGFYWDIWALKQFLTIGIKYRKDKMKMLLKQFIFSSKKKVKILNVGCGSCREIRELLVENIDINEKASFLCIEQDYEAINFAKSLLKKLTQNVEITFLERNALEMIGLKQKSMSVSSHDIIYSMGVADYFLSNSLANFIKFYYRLLKRDGKMIICFCSSHNPKIYTYLRWFCEWNFYAHSPNYIRRFIMDELRIKKVKIIWEKSKPIFFVVIRK